MIRVALLALMAATACTHADSMLVSRPQTPTTDVAVTTMWSRDARAVLRDGDWILTRSYTAIGDAITTVTPGEDVSHAQIYDAKHDVVIESTGLGVHTEPLADVIEQTHVLIVVRPNMTAAERSRSVERARSKIGAGYDYTGLLGLDDPNRYYCSELVWWASEGEQRTGDHYLVIAPSDLLKYGTVVYESGERTSANVVHEAKLEPKARLASN